MATNKQYTLYIGHNVNNTPYWSAGQILAVANAYLQEVGVNGFTTRESRGMYMGVMEDTTEIMIIGLTSELGIFKDVASRLARALRQECVLLTTTDVSAEFVSYAEE